MGFILELGNVIDSLWISLRFNFQITCFCTLGLELMDSLGLIHFVGKKMRLQIMYVVATMWYQETSRFRSYCWSEYMPSLHNLSFFAILFTQRIWHKLGSLLEGRKNILK